MIVIQSQDDRKHAMQLIDAAPRGTCVEFIDVDRRTLAQNKKLWPLLTEIARQVCWYGHWLTADDWKDIFTASLKKETRTVPGIDERSFVVLGMRTSKLSKRDFATLLEIITAFARDKNVKLHDDEAAA
jgi:hypothetical protein